MDPTTTHPELERLLTHQDWLRSLARKLVGDSQTAEDLVQETWMAAMKSPPDPTRPARPWLAGVVRRLASMRARGEGRRTRRQNEVAVADVLPSTADLVEEVDTQRRLVGEVLQLSEPYRTTVMLRYFNNLSSAEIARHQDVPAGTVRWRLKRGLDELRERLDDSFGSRETWSLALLPLAKFGVGTGAATVSSGGSGLFSLFSGMAAAKMVATLLAVVGTFWLGSLIGTRLQPVMASTDRADLASLEPDVNSTQTSKPERVAVEANSRDMLAPETRYVRFLEPTRDPIVGLQVVLDDRSPNPPMGVTNERGEVAFTTNLTQGVLYVRRAGSFMQRLPVSFDAPRVNAFLPWHSELTGRVMAGKGDSLGSLAMGGLRLRLDCDVRLWGDHTISRAVLERFDNPETIVMETEEDGSFRFQNLPADWSGKIWLPEGVCVNGASRRDEAGQHVYFREPRQGAVVLVTDLPNLRGRIVASDGKALSDALVRAWVDGATEPVVGNTDPEGRFELSLDSEGHSGLRLQAVSLDGMQQQDLVFAGNEIPPGFELGDVTLNPSQRITYRAQNALGEPILGARAQSAGQLLVGSATGEDGWGEAVLPSRVQECWIVAAGYQPKAVPPGGTRENRIVELSPASVLNLRVLDAESLSMSNSKVRVWSGERLYAFGEPYQPSGLDRSIMAGTFVGLGQDQDLPSAEFLTDELGRLNLIGLVAGSPLWVEVVDPLGKPIHQHRVTALGDGEVRDERVLVPRLLREFHGIVRDRSGNVLVDVDVRLVDVDGNEVRAQSGLDGQVDVLDLSGDRYNLTIDKRGFVALEIGDFSLSNGVGSNPDQPAEFVLDRGQDVAILIVDMEDQPVLGGVVQATRLSDQKAYVAGPVGAWDQTLQDLDQGAVQMTLTLGGVRYVEVMQAPLVRSVEFRVPSHGTAEVVWTLPESHDRQQSLRLVAVALDAEGQAMQDRDPVVLPIGSRTGNSGVTRFEALLPGDYSVELQRVAPATGLASPRTQTAPSTPLEQWEPMVDAVVFRLNLGEALPVEVDASAALVE